MESCGVEQPTVCEVAITRGEPAEIVGSDSQVNPWRGVIV
jgi:hypothetical protein